MTLILCARVRAILALPARPRRRRPFHRPLVPPTVRECRQFSRTPLGRAVIGALAALHVLPLAAPPAYAFKPRTHLWVGQQVLNDVLPDGRVTIAGRDYAVPAYRVEALRANAEAYRMGHIGPDAHPDMLVGQTLIHPGEPWSVDQWARHVVGSAGTGTGADVAYAYGFLGHIAGDIWAHTYVNLYTGSIFDLGQDGTDGEIRHMALESYIDLYTPELRDHAGTSLTPERAFGSPNDFLRNTLILAPTAAAQYNNRTAVAAHLVAMREFGLLLGELQETVESLAVPPTELERQIRKAALDAGIAVNEHVGVLANAERQLQLARAALEAHQRAVAAAREAVAVQQRIAEDADAAIRDAERLHRSLVGRRQQLQDRVAELAGEIAKTPAKIIERICPRWVPVCRLLEKVNPVYTRLVDARTAAIHAVSAVTSDIQRASGTIASQTARKSLALQQKAAAEAQLLALDASGEVSRGLQVAVDEALRTVDAAKEKQTELEGVLRAAESKLGSLMDLKGSLVTGAIALRIQKWRSDVSRAISAYEQANTDVMGAIIGPGDPLLPLQQWALCWGPVFMSVPSEVPIVACGALDIARNGLQMLRDMRSEIADKAGLLGWVIDPGGRLEKLVEERIRPQLISIEEDVLTRVAGRDAATLVLMTHEKIDPSKLNQQFSVDRDREGILLIPNAAARVEADMQLAGGRFSPTRFPAAANAVTLSKLALLDAAGMQRLLADNGYEQVTLREPFNVLFGTTRSIDGNHQWIGGPAPEFPRRRGSGPPASERRFGMEGPGEPGTLVWLFFDPQRRQMLFQRLFIGPVAPALETPQDLGFSDVLPRGYPRGNQHQPFVWYTRERCKLVLRCDRWYPVPH